jgi:hypothetical protein
MSENVAGVMLNRLAECGVRRIYGYPADGINGLLGAFEAMLFDGAPQPRPGALPPDPGTPGPGLEFRCDDADRPRSA